MWKSTNNQALRERALKVIPGGMYGHESTGMLPPDFPQYFERAEGTRLWDVDGNCYIDYMCAFGPNLLGYGHAGVAEAAARQAALGDTMTGPSAAMVELAELFVGMVSHADWAMFCKNGTDATSMAMVCTRAHHNKRKILVAHGTYHGAAPWCTPNPAGITAEDRSHIIGFRYDDLDSLEQAVAQAGNDLAGIFATPFRHEVFADQFLPSPEYAHRVRAICDERDALLVVDEVRSGFRLARDCSWAALGVQPDLSCWGKAIANGHALSALLGSEKARAAAQRIYVTGSFWFQAVPMAAAVATLRELRDGDYLERITHTGQLLRDGLAAQAATHGFALRQTGPVQMPQILFEDDPDMRMGYAWTSSAIRRGVYLHPYHNMFLNAALTPADVALTLEVTDQAFAELKHQRPTLAPQANPKVLARLQSMAAAQPTRLAA
ncbi:aminotransferase class III-fold pyridoxal phosphate-dependent enzyme [Pseudorhodoferax sp.]|uniref:aminotransferase class III-fold pyridoxal phosphate-dependent enzyme n=1 Tax=Pseudorhodoferax sp. TaxID=1993553 RepID=UPI002DD6A423|nr:aminotransferase class III-fold pyridoxal phosphate-dependent enzyme [Pseudorhodoferax sp.]